MFDISIDMEGGRAFGCKCQEIHTPDILVPIPGQEVSSSILFDLHSLLTHLTLSAKLLSLELGVVDLYNYYVLLSEASTVERIEILEQFSSDISFPRSSYWPRRKPSSSFQAHPLRFNVPIKQLMTKNTFGFSKSANEVAFNPARKISG